MIVLDQINNLFHSNDPEVQREANNYLTKWQRTIEAWAESHSILNSNFQFEAKFIAAQTLRIKILYDFYQLPSDCFLKICESLLSYLNQDGLPRNISSTIGLAVCDMAIQMAESWDSPVESFINYYKSNRLNLETVLFLLETFPEETSNNRLILTPEVHTKVNFKLKSEYVKVVEFLSLIRNNLTQISSSMKVSESIVNDPKAANVINYKMIGKILKVWNNWRRFDTFSSNGDLCRNFLNDCLEIIKNPNLRNEGLEEETYETSVDCMVDLLQECSYLTNNEVYGTSSEDYPEVNRTRYNDLVEVQRACFKVLVEEMQSHMHEAYKNRDIFLFNNLSRLFVNLVDSIHIDHKSTDSNLILLMDYLVKFIELPYLLLYSNTTISDLVNPFNRENNHLKSRELIMGFLSDLITSNKDYRNLNTVNYMTNFNSTQNTHRTEGQSVILDLDDEVCNISQKCVHILVDILSKFSKTFGNSLLNVQSINLLTTTTPGLVPYVVSNVLQLLLMITLNPYQLYFRCFTDEGMFDSLNCIECLDNYNYYIGDVLELYQELLRLINRGAVLEYFKSNLTNLPNFTNNTLLIQSSFVLLPQCLIFSQGSSSHREGFSNTPRNSSSQLTTLNVQHSQDVHVNNENVNLVNQLINLISDIFKSGDQMLTSVRVPTPESMLMLTIKINSVKFLGQIKRVFSLPDTHEMLKQVMIILTNQLVLNVGGLFGTGGLGVGRVEELKELHDKLKYESGYSISLICYHIKMEKLKNNQEILSILLNSLENVDNELLVMILEGLAISCYNLNQNDLIIVFNQIINNTLNQLVGVINSYKGVGGGITIQMNTPTQVTKEGKLLIINLLNRIVGFVRNLKNRPELDPMVGERIFPILVNLLNIFHLDNQLVEVICRCIKHNARVLGVYFSKYISILVQTISNVAQIKMFGTYLYLIEWLHSIFYGYGTTSSSRSSSNSTDTPSNADEKEILNLYNLLTVLTLKIFKKSFDNYPPNSSISSLSSTPYTRETDKNEVLDNKDDHVTDTSDELLIEDFYGLQAEFFLNSDNYLSDLSIVNEIINCSCKFLFIKRPQCVFYFWESLLKISKYNQQISNLTSQYLQTLLNNCIIILTLNCTKSVEHYVENLISSVISYVRSNYFVYNISQLPPHLSNGSLTQNKDQLLHHLFSVSLSNLPVEIISNEKLRLSFLSGLINKTKSTVNHIYKLSAKLSMRNRI